MMDECAWHPASSVNVPRMLEVMFMCFIFHSFLIFYFLFIFLFFFKDFIYLFMIVTHTHREREAETQAEGEAGSMHREPDMGFDSGSPGSCPGPKAGAKPLRHSGIPVGFEIFLSYMLQT